MATGFFSISNQQQEFTVLIDQVLGVGGYDSPILNIPVKINFYPVQKSGNQHHEFNIVSLKGEIMLTDQNIRCPENIIPASYKVYGPTSYSFTLKFPITAFTLSRIEKYRQGNLKAILDLQLQIAYNLELPSNLKLNGYGYISGFENATARANFEIEQSLWARKILPGLGYKAATFLEIPNMFETISPEYENTNQELIAAQNYLKENDADKAVAHCRSALEPFRDHLTEIKRLFESDTEYKWAKEILTSTYEWLEKILKSTYTITNKTHHYPSLGHFSRTDAEIIFTVTSSIIAFISKSGFKFPLVAEQ